MIRLFSLAIDVIPAGIIATILVFLLKGRLFGSVRRCLACAVLAFYLLAVYSLTGIPAVNSLTLDLGINPVPLAGIAGDIKNAALNVLLFVPLGLLLPLLWREFRSFPRTALTGLLLSLCIEILQIFTFRYTDVNDLLTNTVGAMLGFLLGQAALRGREQAFRGEGGAAREFAALLVITFAIAFLIQPFISSALWGLIYA